MRLDRFTIALALSLAAGSAMAHGDHGFFPGFVHMFSGAGHLPAALLTVVSGLLAVRQTGVLRWTFGGLAAAGGALLFAI
ncbi:hypothetical protein [Aromatoleum diolicum]|uniref:Urease accessory protein UreJ n=1 Tax=Aromatoleum diolicum TaxID=75796 RepID=A0ABX1QG70_9RHOO|nr:hypothetical protein [Aromatoleum diolicum]NMG77394.1 hypothetical protein [Aromatoleum diolicum]